MGVSRRVAWLVELAGIKGNEADRLVRRPRNSTKNLIASRSDPRCSHAQRYAELFGVTLDWLIAGKGEKPTEDHVRAAVERARQKLAKGPAKPLKVAA